MDYKQHKIIGNKLYQYSPTSSLYMTNGNFLRKYVQNWKYNRPTDKLKVKEIIEDIEKNNSVEGIIYIAQLGSNYYCYDGNHRLEAIKILNLQKLVLVNLMIVKSHHEIMDRFIKINKSNPVSELYITNEYDKDSHIKLKAIIEEIVTNISNTFPKHMSTSKNPRKPNYNRDKLMDILYEKLKYTDISLLSSNNIYNKILKLNQQYANKIHIDHSNFTKSIMKKCIKNGCYIFLKNFTEDLELSI